MKGSSEKRKEEIEMLSKCSVEKAFTYRRTKCQKNRLNYKIRIRYLKKP